MNDILWKCCEYLNEMKPEFSGDTKSFVLFLHVLVSFTSTSNWIVLKKKNMEIIKAGMNQLCANLMGQLFHKGFYLVLKVTIQSFYYFKDIEYTLFLDSCIVLYHNNL